MSLLTSQGNLKSQTITNEVLIDKRTHKIVKYWQKVGFPYIDTDEKFRQDKFDAFLKVDDMKSLDFNNRSFKFNNAGLALAWSYHPHAFEVQCNNQKSPMDVFNDYDTFSKGIKKTLKGSFFKKRSFEELMTKNEQTNEMIRTVLRRVSGAQMVSNFRPITASALYKLFCDKNDTVWDMSCGWGGRLLASIKAEINYIGTDPNTQTQKGLKEMVTTFGNEAYGYDLLTMGSEEYRPDKNSLDFAFTSPPYFDTEKYSETETTQSYLKYSNINAWKEDFLRKTLENVHYGLKPNKFCAFNVADVKSYETFEKDTKQIASEVGFKLVDTFDLRLSSQANDYKAEPIFIFKKEQ
jgi:hypothetical protein